MTTCTVRPRCYMSRTTWTFFPCNIWYTVWTQRTSVTTLPCWNIHHGKWRRHFTRHCHTVLPLLAITKKYILQAIHTSFVNTAIDNMTNNRVLYNKPPSINSEEFSFLDDNRQLYHSSVPIIASLWIPTKTDWSKLTLQVVQTVEWIHMMYPNCSNALKPQLFITCEFMGQANQEDMTTALSGPGQPELTDDDGWRGHTITTERVCQIVGVYVYSVSSCRLPTGKAAEQALVIVYTYIYIYIYIYIWK